DVRTLIIKEAHAMKYSVRPGAETGESKMIGLEMEQETTKEVVIKKRLKEAKVSVVRVDKKGELAPSCYVAIRTLVWVSKVIELTWAWDDYLKDKLKYMIDESRW
nr:hypothetical protein [Tanacetum cinerariifolium]